MNKFFRFICIFLTTRLSFILLSNLLRKQKSFTSIIKNWCSTVLGSFAYLIPLHLTIEHHQGILHAMGCFKFLLKAPSTVKNLNLSWNIFEPRMIDIVLGFLYNKGQDQFVFIIYCLVILKGRRNTNVSYFIKFHLMHAILFVYTLMPFGLFLGKLQNSQIGGKSMKIFWLQLGYASAIANFSLILYCMFSAATHNYFKLPVYTGGAKLHLGPNMSK
jgi:hypothetical protein